MQMFCLTILSEFCVINSTGFDKRENRSINEDEVAIVRIHTHVLSTGCEGFKLLRRRK